MGNTKPHVLSVRLEGDAFQRIAEAAQAAGLTPSAWVRLALIGVAGSGLELPVAPPGTAPGDSHFTHVISGKLTAEQFAAVQGQATQCGMTMAAFVRAAVLGVTPRPRRPMGDKAIAELGRVGNNLNQLTKLANSGTVMPLDLARSVAEVHAAVRHLREALELEGQ
jgi:antitoxin component of RelBE/YafQ-DinJ toxin-antitoxin module